MTMTPKRESILGPTPFHTSRACRASLSHADGFSLIELMLAVAIVGVLAALAIPNYVGFLEKARIARTISELHGLAKEIQGFAWSAGTYPNSLADVGRSTLLDPWGTPYQYYRINCGTVDDIPNLAKLKLRRNSAPYVMPATYTPSSGTHRPALRLVHTGDFPGQIFLVQGAGAGAAGAAAGGAGAGGAGAAAGGAGAGGAGAAAGGAGGGPPCGGVGGARKDRFLVPINSDFDIYSMGTNRDSVAPLNPPKSQDDVVRASDGGFYGLARNF